MSNEYDSLRLKNQVCFPMYACSKDIVKKYKPFLNEIGLTYTQYITMMVMWEYKEINVKDLGKYLFLDSGTLTPVLKKLEQKGYVSRTRDIIDERVLIVRLTEKGDKLQNKAIEIPTKIRSCISLSDNELNELYEILNKLLYN